MKTIRHSAFLLTMLVFTAPVFGQYQPASPYLQAPELAIGYVDSCAVFWLQTWDTSTGGFFTNIDRDGTVLTSWGTNKNMLTQSRNAYGLTRAYMMTGDTTYLGYAKRALEWMYDHAWDATYGGWFQELNGNGSPTKSRDDKTAFYQHYALLGTAAYYEATRDSLAWQWLLQGHAHLENNFWDARTGYEGYYDKTDYRGSNASGKSFNATVDAITTHLLSLWQLTEDAQYRERLLELAREIRQHLVGSMPRQSIGFVEKFDTDWNWNNGETLTLMGHVLKAGWCLGRIHQLFPDTAFVSAAGVLIEDVWQNGYDHTYGGPYKDYNRVTGEMQLWGLPDPAKAWWQMEQAIVGGLELYDITQEDVYLRMADESMEFYMRHFVDHTFGEVYADRTHTGGIAWNEAKASGGKAGYHSIETGFYSYIYGSFFYTRQPVTLHYQFQSAAMDREIKLTPLAIADDRLGIVDVQHAGMPYTSYGSSERVLSIPAGTGGHFAVTYAPVLTGISTNAAPAGSLPALQQNAPNPFGTGSRTKASSTVIRYSLPRRMNVTISVHDMLGRNVRTLLEADCREGLNSITWDGRDANGRDLPAGMYLCRLHSGTFIATNRMLLLR